MLVSIENLRMTLSLLFMGFDRFDFAVACRVRAQIHVLRLLLTSADDEFRLLLDEAHARVVAKIHELNNVDLPVFETEG